MPVKKMDDNGEPVGVTSTSFVVEFQLLPEQELNGLVDEYVHTYLCSKGREGIK